MTHSFCARLLRNDGGNRRPWLNVKVVGVGSVGTACLIALYMAADDDPLFLQFKEAVPSVLEPFLASAESDYVVAQTYNVDGGQWMSRRSGTVPSSSTERFTESAKRAAPWNCANARKSVGPLPYIMS